MIVQRELNTLGTRQIVPQGPGQFLMIWTMFGFAGDSDEMTRHRLRQGNLMGPAGFLGLEDNEAMKFVQDGLAKSRPAAAVIEFGGTAEGTSPDSSARPRSAPSTVTGARSWGSDARPRRGAPAPICDRGLSR